MNEPAWFEPLRLTDAARLRLEGINLNDARSLTDIREAIRGLTARCGHRLWLAGLGEQSPAHVAVIGLEMTDHQARRAVMHVHAGTAGLHLDLIRALMERAFWQIGIYRLEWFLPASASHELDLCREIGFASEGLRRNSLYDPLTRRHQDLVALSLLRPEYRTRSTAFIPFKLGVYAVTGHQEGLQYACFVRYGEPLADEYQYECAEIAGILDEQGCLADRQTIGRLLDSNGSFVPIDAPPPVLRAAEQVQAYFAGKLTTFDLPVDLGAGSAFQTRVWEALTRIPFGTTWTYEELASQLTGEDWAAARRMSRAVGSACGANPLPLILPCHRVIGKDRKLVGFSGGLDVKEFLLDHEMMRCQGGLNP